MKRVLYIAFFFPPLGGAGVQRTLKFVRYLPASGWRATVVTSKAHHWMHDDSLLAELDAETRILRAPFWGGRLVAGRGGSSARPRRRPEGATQPPSQGASQGGPQGTADAPPPRAEGPSPGSVRSRGRIRSLRALARLFLVPDAYLGWAMAAERVARTELSRARYDAVITTSSPDSAHLLGRRLKRRTGIPWVADFRDPWTRRLSYAPASRWHDRIHHRLERSCLNEADRIVVTTEETRADFLARYPDLPPDKIAVIPNGYDEEDFTAAASLAESTELPRARILHAGQLNPERPIAPYLDGLRLFLDREPSRAREAETLFLGGHYDADREVVRGYGLEQVVRFQAGCMHRQSVAALLRARVLLLLEQDSDRGRLLLPGKIFEYLRAGRPILAVVPLGGAADRLVRSMDAGFVADPSSPAQVAEGIGRLLDVSVFPEPASGQLTPDSAQGITRFERRSLAAQLASVLDGFAPA